MATCTLTTNIALPCRRDPGGIKRVFITDLQTAQASVTLSTGTTGAVSSISGSTNWFIYDFRNQTGTFLETENVNDANNSIFYTPSVKLILNNLSVTLRNEMYQLANIYSVVIVQTNIDTFWLLGIYNGLIKKGTAGAGKAGGDHSGYTVDLEGFEPLPMYSVPTSVMQTAFGQS